jgi:hypothetical protein
MNPVDAGKSIIVLLITLGLSACGDSQRPQTPPDVHLSLQITGSWSGAPRVISVSAVVWNTSDSPALSWDSCCGNIYPYLEIRDPGGQVIRSNECLAMCPPRPGQLEKDPVMATLPFNGFVWASSGGGWVPGPDGEYTVIATFHFIEFEGGPVREVREERKFTWSGQ